MGQKVNPHGLRVGVIKDWDSRWFANKADFGDTLVEDFNVRKFIKKNLYAAGVPKIEIERFADKVRIHIHCAKPGIVIGRGGAEIEKLRTQLEKMMGKQVYVNIVEVKQPDMDAQLVAEKIALDLENRISFRRAMKQAIGRAMRLGAKGIKTKVSGRLGGAEIARSESYHEGTIPLQTIRADIDYGTAEAHTTYGRLQELLNREKRLKENLVTTATVIAEMTEDVGITATTVTVETVVSVVAKKEKEVNSNAASEESKIPSCTQRTDDR